MKLSKRLGSVLLILFVFLLPVIIRTNTYFLHVLIITAINVIFASSLRAIATVGHISMGSMAFTGIGAYTSAILMKKLAFPFWAAFPLSGFAAVFVAAVVAFPFVRVTGMYFAMLTLFFCEVIRLISTQWTSMTGGSSGMLKIPSIGALSMFGININFAEFLPYCYFVFVIVLLIHLILYRIHRSHIGTTLEAIEKDEQVAASVGINVIRYKVIIFCIGCFITGLGGSLYAHHVRVLSPDSFGLFQSIYIMIYVVVGGRKKFAGAIVGAVVLTFIPEMFRGLKEYQPFVFAAVLFFVLFFLRGGLVDLPEKIKSRMIEIRKRKKLYA